MYLKFLQLGPNLLSESDVRTFATIDAKKIEAADRSLPLSKRMRIDGYFSSSILWDAVKLSDSRR